MKKREYLGRIISPSKIIVLSVYFILVIKIGLKRGSVSRKREELTRRSALKVQPHFISN